MTMDINSICTGHEIPIREVPAGTSLPPAAEVTAADILALGEMSWALSELNNFLAMSTRMKAQLGRPQQSGGISDHAWSIWTEVSRQLETNTGVAQAALPLELIINGLIERLETEGATQNAADLTILRIILSGTEDVQGYESYIADFQQELSSGNYPIAEQVGYDRSRSFKHNIRPILERINSQLSEAVQAELNLAQIVWTSQTISAASVEAVLDRVIGIHGQEGVEDVAGLLDTACTSYAAAIPEPLAPEVPEVPETPQPGPRRFEYGLDLVPSYAVQLAGETTAPITSGPLLQGDAAFGYHINEQMLLQLTYQAMLGVNSFSDWTSDMSYDTGILSFRYNDLTVQGSYIYQRDFMNNMAYHLGALGVGYSLFEGYLEPFGGGIFGGNTDGIGGGGFVGLRSSQIWQVGDSDISRIGYSIQALGTLLYMDQLNIRPGGTAAFTWRPVSFGGADLEISAQVSGLYNTEPSGANIAPGLTIGWNTQNRITPYPAFLY